MSALLCITAKLIADDRCGSDWALSQLFGAGQLLLSAAFSCTRLRFASALLGRLA
jgi:hypothetical protein